MMKRERKLVSFDWALKRLLRNKANFDVLEGFLSELLREDVRILQVLESESDKGDDEDHYNRVDVLVQDARGDKVIIEVQYEYQFDFLQRILFGVSKAISESLDAGEKYAELPQVISVNILYFDLGQGEDYVYHGTTSFQGIHTNDTLRLSERQRKRFGKDNVYKVFPEYYLLKVNSFDDVAKDGLDEWMYFLKHEEIRDDTKAKGLKAAKRKLDVMKLNDKQRRDFEKHQMNLHDMASVAWTRYEEGKEDGQKVGMEKGRIEVALEMKKKKLPSEMIARCTGLPLEEINKL